MKKLKELNLVPDYGVASYPLQKRHMSHNGGPTGSADSTYSRNVMQRVNKNMQNEEDSEETEEDIEIVLKEFVDANLDKLGSVAKSGIFSIPVFGDILAFGKFLFTITKLRYHSRLFASQFGELADVDLGDDILEPEGSLKSDEELDKNLQIAVTRLSNLNDYPELTVTKRDIDNLYSKYFLMCKYVKDAIIEFIGFADVAFGQKGFFLNIAISSVSYSSLPDFILGKYANTVDEMYAKSRESNSTPLSILEKAASFFISAPQELLDFLGNADLLLNIDKLARLSAVHNMFRIYKDVDTFEEKATAGFDAIPGTPFDMWLEENYANYSLEAYSKYAGTAETMAKISDLKDVAPESSKFLASIVNSDNPTIKEVASILLREEYSLSSIYEDMKDEDSEEDPLEEFSGGGVPMSAIPLGTKPGNPKKSGGKPSIYTASDFRNFQNFASKTLGNKK